MADRVCRWKEGTVKCRVLACLVHSKLAAFQILIGSATTYRYVIALVLLHIFISTSLSLLLEPKITPNPGKTKEEHPRIHSFPNVQSTSAQTRPLPTTTSSKATQQLTCLLSTDRLQQYIKRTSVAPVLRQTYS